MENADGVIIYQIVHKFKRVAGAVKPDNGVLFRKPINGGGIYFGFKRVQNILLANMMPKRRLVELNNDVHASTIPQKPPEGNKYV